MLEFYHDKDNLLFLFFKVQKLLFAKSSEILEKINIYPGQPPLLLVLHHSSGVTQKELAKKLNVTPPTIAVMLRRLEKYDLIEKKLDEKDRRVYRVYLSKKGKMMIGKLHEIMEELEKIVFNGFDEKEKETLKKFLDKMANNIKMSLERGKIEC